MEALNTRWVRSTPRRTLSSEVAPTASAPSGPASTTAASVAAELGDHADCREVRVVGVESQTPNSNASTTSVNPDLMPALSVSASEPSACASTAMVASTTTAAYSRATGESRDDGSPLDRCPLPVTMPAGSPPGDTWARGGRACLGSDARGSSRELAGLPHRSPPRGERSPLGHSHAVLEAVRTQGNLIDSICAGIAAFIYK